MGNSPGSPVKAALDAQESARPPAKVLNLFEQSDAAIDVVAFHNIHANWTHNLLPERLRPEDGLADSYDLFNGIIN